MISSSRTLLKIVTVLAVSMLVVVAFHIGGGIGQFAQLVGALIGGSIALISVLIPSHHKSSSEPWLDREKWGWLLIGSGVLMWGFGESFWRYYILAGQSPFPSLADIGYSAFPLLIFAGLLLQPSSGKEAGHRQLLLLLDSLVSMGSILAIAWYLLLGSLAQAPGEANLAKFLGLYYPGSDIALLSCVVFLLLRGVGHAYQATARRASLQILGLGLCFFVCSDFIFNIQNNAGTYVDATWLDMGWPLGMLIIGIAAHLRSFLPATSEELLEIRMQLRDDRMSFGLPQLLPYVLLGVLLLVLTLNVLSTDPGQIAIRPVLLVLTLSVVALVVIRQILTLRENIRLANYQARVVVTLEKANKRIEEQARQIAQHSAELGAGIEHLRDVQANLATGNLRARAHLNSGELLPLAASLNLMAERLIRLWQMNEHARRLIRALEDLSAAFERYWSGNGLTVPDSCHDLVEITRLLNSLHIRTFARSSGPLPPSYTQQSQPIPATPLSRVSWPTQSSQPGAKPPIQQKRVRFQSDMSTPTPAPRTDSGNLNGFQHRNGPA